MDKRSMSRAAFLPSPGDPFVLLHCIHYFKTVWYDEVDKLYVCINSDIEQGVISELMELLKDPKIVVSYFPYTLGHGKALSLMLTQCEEDSIMLIEDDSIIFKKGVVDKYFKVIENESKIAIGSARMSCPAEVATEAAREFNLNYEGWGDRGPAFWPCFFFSTRNNFHYIDLATNHNLGASEKGDTFVLASLEFRHMAKNHFATQQVIKHIPQYHCSPDDNQNHDADRGIFDGECGYMHFGSLSSGIENTLLDYRGIPLKERTKNVTSVEMRIPQTDQERIELERRVLFWKEAHDLNCRLFGDFGIAYGHAVERVVSHCNLSWDSINNLKKLYYSVIQS